MTQTQKTGLNWINSFEIEATRYACIRDGFVTSCAVLAPDQTLADAIADYRTTYDNNGEAGTTHCRATLIEDGDETQVEQFDFTV